LAELPASVSTADPALFSANTPLAPELAGTSRNTPRYVVAEFSVTLTVAVRFAWVLRLNIAPVDAPASEPMD